MNSWLVSPSLFSLDESHLFSEETQKPKKPRESRAHPYSWGFDIPAAPIEKVENTSARLIDEMELQEHVPNWQLLYQLLLVRETSRQLHPNADDLGVYGTTVISSSFSPSEIPKAEVREGAGRREGGVWIRACTCIRVPLE